MFSKVFAIWLRQQRETDVMRGKTRIFAAAPIISLMRSMPAAAQMLDMPIWSNGIEKDKSRSVRGCTADLLPAADRRKMEQDFIRLARDDGRGAR